jgi:aspartate/methionine/tyrosine aminotransferase
MPTDTSSKTGFFTESVIRQMTRRALKCGAVNLAQGFPDFPAPEQLKIAAKRAIDEDYNQYAVTHGSPNFKAAIAVKEAAYNRLDCDPDLNITVTCGSTEAMVASLLAVINPGDEVIIFEPFYENYGPDTILAGATPKYVELRDPRLFDRFKRASSRLQPANQGDYRKHPTQPHWESVQPDRVGNNRSFVLQLRAHYFW